MNELRMISSFNQPMSVPRRCGTKVVELEKRVSFAIDSPIHCERETERHELGSQVDCELEKRVSFSIDSSINRDSSRVDRFQVECAPGKLTEDSGHISEASYDLAWDRDRGWSRRRVTNITESDHSLPLDVLNTPIHDDLSDRYV